MNLSLLNYEVAPPSCKRLILPGGELPPPATEVKDVLLFLIIFNIFALPFTAVLNGLVVVAVRTKSRLRTKKSNILLACTAVSDLAVGVMIIQPMMFIALTISVFVGKRTIGSCALQPVTILLTNFLCDTSLIHLVLIGWERYLAIKHAHAYNTRLVTEARLLIASICFSMDLFSYHAHSPFLSPSSSFLN